MPHAAPNDKPGFIPRDHLKPGRVARDEQDAARLKAEIEARYKQPRDKDDDPQRHVALLRMTDIETMRRASDVSADDWEFLTAAANHLAFVYRRQPAKIAAIVMWSRRFTPSIPDDRARLLAHRIVANPCMLTADKLGLRLGLTIEMRAALGITTIGAIGMSKAQRLALRKQKDAEGARWRRAARSTGKPRGRPSKGKPWEAKGISRRTWYRQRQKDVALQQDGGVSRRGTKMRRQHSLSIYADDGSSCHLPPRAPISPTAFTIVERLTTAAPPMPPPKMAFKGVVLSFVPVVHVAPSSLWEPQ